jgi:transposase
MSFTHANAMAERDPTETEVRARMMKVLIGVDPHKASVALAVVDEAVGELLECASFPQNRSGLRALERWAKRFPKRRWAVENAGGLGRHLAQRLAAAGEESVVDVPPKLSARVRVLSTGNARKTDELDALATALAAWRNERLAAVDPEAGTEVMRLLSERRSKTWWPSVLGRSTASTGFYGISCLAGYAERSRPTEPPASCAAYGRKGPRPVSADGLLRRSCATSGPWSERSRT